jgi:DNA mismatch endonuclease (patch repair protein)
MPDIVSPEVRSRMMSGIRGRDTKPELVLRKGLHALGLRYRISPKDVPGKPDMVFPKYHAVILAHGCFWHGHDCHLFRWPSSRREFWRAKITRNRERDREVREQLASAGWRMLTVWECALKGRTRRPAGEVVSACAGWLASGEPAGEIRGSDE